mmetsp:Transcript_48731/g.110592  ORF Transcript_48731/g.110592 Transcript_48731/m.110592 type:complete len:270 (-) Transcript_48731:177-986(-)
MAFEVRSGKRGANSHVEPRLCLRRDHIQGISLSSVDRDPRLEHRHVERRHVAKLASLRMLAPSFAVPPKRSFLLFSKVQRLGHDPHELRDRRVCNEAAPVPRRPLGAHQKPPRGSLPVEHRESWPRICESFVECEGDLPHGLELLRLEKGAHAVRPAGLLVRHEGQPDRAPRPPPAFDQPAQGLEVLAADTFHVLRTAAEHARPSACLQFFRHHGSVSIAVAYFGGEGVDGPMLSHHGHHVVVRVQNDAGQLRLGTLQLCDHNGLVFDR